MCVSLPLWLSWQRNTNSQLSQPAGQPAMAKQLPRCLALTLLWFLPPFGGRFVVLGLASLYPLLIPTPCSTFHHLLWLAPFQTDPAMTFAVWSVGRSVGALHSAFHPSFALCAAQKPISPRSRSLTHSLSLSPSSFHPSQPHTHTPCWVVIFDKLFTFCENVQVRPPVRPFVACERGCAPPGREGGSCAPVSTRHSSIPLMPTPSTLGTLDGSCGKGRASASSNTQYDASLSGGGKEGPAVAVC